MRVILLSDQRHLGKRGEVVDVKPGFGRNYLVPQGIALEASKANIKYFEQQRSKIDAEHAKERDAAAEIAARLTGVRLEVPKRVGETGTLYGSVTAGDVAELLEKKGFTVDRRRIDLEGGIKALGDHPVRVELHPEVVAEVIVSVVAEE
ncbi:MAG: large subunit ribosomal protein [Acidobacteriota bacterium]|nr:large subunit ribosomal protein [Acidobacteriota bacterium]